MRHDEEDAKRSGIGRKWPTQLVRAGHQCATILRHKQAQAIQPGGIRHGDQEGRHLVH